MKLILSALISTGTPGALALPENQFATAKISVVARESKAALRAAFVKTLGEPLGPAFLTNLARRAFPGGLASVNKTLGEPSFKHAPPYRLKTFTTRGDGSYEIFIPAEGLSRSARPPAGPSCA